MTIERAPTNIAEKFASSSFAPGSFPETRRKEDRQPVAILLVSPNPAMRLQLRERLAGPRWQLAEALTGAGALDLLYEKSAAPQVLLLDPLLPDLEPIEFAATVRRDFPGVQILTLDSATGHLLLGVASPTAVSTHISDLLHPALTPPEIAREDVAGGANNGAISLIRGGSNISRIARMDGRAGIRGMVGDSEPMRRVYELVHLVAARNTTVVVTGESGTGKDLVAQAIHLLSPRQRQPFVVINCAAIPEPLLEAELFGYVKGSFTGATQSRIGRIHAAHGGTLFLDEIGDMPLALQSKILRFLEQGEVQRLGGNDNLKVDVRVIAATNADLKRAVQQKLFREDLYYRLMVFPIVLPSLRERLEDVVKLAESFLTKFSPGTVLGSDAIAALEQHGWPGNVRELRNVIERATILAGDEQKIEARHIVL